MPVSEETYLRVAAEDPEGHWELCGGRLRRKPDMTADHNWIATLVGYLLLHQLRWDEFQVRVNLGRVRRSPRNYFIPDVVVIPTALVRRLRGRPDLLEVYAEPPAGSLCRHRSALSCLSRRG